MCKREPFNDSFRNYHYNISSVVGVAEFRSTVAFRRLGSLEKLRGVGESLGLRGVEEL